MGDISYGEIPRVQVWGDGHIVWVTYTKHEYRQVWEGFLSDNQMENVIDQFIQAGFFTPYRRLIKRDFAFDSLAIYLSDANHEEMIDPGYSRIYELVEYLYTGAGAEPTAFTPNAGLLFAFPIEETEFHGLDVNAPYTWPDREWGYTLEFLGSDGYSITDSDQITFIWDIVNSPTPFVNSDGQIYWIVFAIPGISY